MKRAWIRSTWILLAAGLAACTNQPAGGDQKSPSTPAVAATSDASTTATETADTSGYDPAMDPLVNPKAIFETFPAAQPSQANEDDTLVVHLDGNPTSMNPIFFSSMQDMQAQDPLYLSLFSTDAKFNWETNPDAVESFADAPDHLSSTVKLKPGLNWQDGEPLTAEDVRFSWQTIMDEQVPVPAVRSGTDQLADVQAIDPLTVRYVYKEVLATNKWNISFPIIPKHIFGNPVERQKDPSLSKSDYFVKYNREGAVGSGPYKLVSWTANDQIVFERWDGYTGRKWHFKKLIFKIQPDQNTTLLFFKQGGLDMVDRITAQQFARETNGPDFSSKGWKAKGTEWSYSFIGWNLDGSNPFFKDKDVRYAMACAMNVPEIIQQISYGLTTRCAGIFHPDSWMYNPEIKMIDFDLDKAAALLDKAGWKINSDDGLRYKTINGAPVKFEFTMIIPEGSKTSVQVAARYRANLAKIGVTLKTQLIEWATYQEKTHNHEFQASIQAWGSGSDPDGEWNLWRTDQYKDGRNYGGYSNPRVDELLLAGRRELDQAKRAKIYQEIDKIIYDDQPYLFLTNPPTLAIVSKRMRGIAFSPAGLFGFDPGEEGWWFPANTARPM